MPGTQTHTKTGRKLANKCHFKNHITWSRGFRPVPHVSKSEMSSDLWIQAQGGPLWWRLSESQPGSFRVVYKMHQDLLFSLGTVGLTFSELQILSFLWDSIDVRRPLLYKLSRNTHKKLSSGGIGDRTELVPTTSITLWLKKNRHFPKKKFFFKVISYWYDLQFQPCLKIASHWRRRRRKRRS